MLCNFGFLGQRLTGIHPPLTAHTEYASPHVVVDPNHEWRTNPYDKRESSIWEVGINDSRDCILDLATRVLQTNPNDPSTASDVMLM